MSLVSVGELQAWREVRLVRSIDAVLRQSSMPTTMPQTKLLGIAAIASLLLAAGAFVMAWRAQDLGFGDGTAATRAAEEANRVGNAYAIVGFVMIATTVFTLVLRHLAKRRLVTRPS